jgi:hypothetical protein
MLKKIMDDRKRIDAKIIDVSFRELIDDRASLLNSLSNKLEIPIKRSREVGESSKFFKSKYSLNPSSYNISKEGIEESFSFYTKEYSKYL